MPTPTIRLTKSQEDALAAACALGSERLLKISGALDSDDSSMIKPAKLRQMIADQTDQGTARIVARFLIGLATLRRRSFSSASELLDGLSEGLAAVAWDTDRLDAWRKCRPAFEKLLESKVVALTAKAVDLTFDFSEFCIGARILTDVRPIFDDLREKIVGAAITQTLRLEYAGRNGDYNTISVSLDLDDIRRLRDSCGEALRKADVAKRMVEEKWGTGTISATEVMNERG
jgi:hypothetical protein